MICAIQDHRTTREHGISVLRTARAKLMDNLAIESGDSSGYESGVSIPRLPWRKQETVEEH